MVTVAYACIDPYFESPPSRESWGQAVDHIYIDQGHPIGQRPELQQLLQDCCRTPPETVLVWRLGDLADSATAVLDCIEALENHGITVQSWTPPYCTAADPNPLHHRHRIIALTEHIQAQHRSQRLQSGHAANRIQVLPPPGRAPYGYRRGKERYALDRTAAPVVRAFFERFLLFGSIREAVRYLEKTYGKRVSASTGQRWLTHPIYRGDLTYKDNRTVRDTHTPIISREEAAQVDRLLKRNRRLPPKTSSAPRSLAGLVKCQTCTSRFKISRVTRPRHSREYLYLRPIACQQPQQPCRALPYDQVLEKTIQGICQALPDAIANLQTPPVGMLKARLLEPIQQKESAIQALSGLVEQGVLDETTAKLRTYILQGELSDLQQTLSQLPPENLSQVVQTLSIPRFWHDLSEVERRVYFREFIETVWISRCDLSWNIHIRFVF